MGLPFETNTAGVAARDCRYRCACRTHFLAFDLGLYMLIFSLLEAA